MEDLERQRKTISLGKLLVEELGIENEHDTLSRWMAHYLADKITILEDTLLDVDAEDIKKDCFETILQLWEHRWEMSPMQRPLENFEPILRVLNDIAPENQSMFFYRGTHASSRFNDTLSTNTIEKYTDAIVRIDRIARIWIEFLLNEATKEAKKNSSDDFLEVLKGMEEGQDIKAINVILEDIDSYKEKELKERIAELEHFSKLNEYILGLYKNKLAEIEQKPQVEK